MKKNKIKRNCKFFFSVNFNPIDTNDILDIHKYLMKRTQYEIMLCLIKKKFIGLLTGLVNGSSHKKCVLLNNQKCTIQANFISLHANEYSQEFHYYPFAIKVYRCVGICNTLNDLSNKLCVSNKTEDFNLSMFMFHIISGIKE